MLLHLTLHVYPKYTIFPVYFYPEYSMFLDFIFIQSIWYYWTLYSLKVCYFPLNFPFLHIIYILITNKQQHYSREFTHSRTFHYHRLPLRRLINDIGLGSGSWVYCNTMVTVGSDAELSVHGSSLLARCNIYKPRLTMANGCKYVWYWLHNFPRSYPKYEEWITTAPCLPSSL